MKNLVLTGFMGTGKTTIGKALAKRLGYKFIDTDEIIFIKDGRSISDIFAQDGEQYFRELETKCVYEIGALSNCVISTGGGIVVKKENIDALRKNGIIINLCAKLETILQRTGISNQRPLLDGKSSEDINTLLKSRKRFYENCDYKIEVDDKSPLMITNEVISLYKKHIGR